MRNIFGGLKGDVLIRGTEKKHDLNRPINENENISVIGGFKYILLIKNELVHKY